MQQYLRQIHAANNSRTDNVKDPLNSSNQQPYRQLADIWHAPNHPIYTQTMLMEKIHKTTEHRAQTCCPTPPSPSATYKSSYTITFSSLKLHNIIFFGGGDPWTLGNKSVLPSFTNLVSQKHYGVGTKCWCLAGSEIEKSEFCYFFQLMYIYTKFRDSIVNGKLHIHKKSHKYACKC